MSYLSDRDGCGFERDIEFPELRDEGFFSRALQERSGVFPGANCC